MSTNKKKDDRKEPKPVHFPSDKELRAAYREFLKDELGGGPPPPFRRSTRTLSELREKGER